MRPEFDPTEHRYTLQGRVVPSVTQVISMAGMVDYSMVDRDTLEYSAQRGTYVHEATALFDRDQLDMRTLDPVLAPYLRGWTLFRQQCGFSPIHIEHSVGLPSRGYAGTVDRVGPVGRRLAVLDIKTTATLGRHIGLQLAAYMRAYNTEAAHRGDRQATRIYAVQLRADGGYDLRDYTPTYTEDLAAFDAALRLYQWRLKGS